MSTTTERVGRYQILEPIGAGPCGTVSRAKVFGVAGFERQFAVKRFHPELTITSALAQALSAAARAYGSLEHPRIARMSEFGVAQGQTFTAVEMVAGLDAARLIAEARLGGTTLPSGGALAVVSQAARAVGYAHGRGLSHLGLAPTNVIVTVDGDIKITDFGILAAGMPQRPIDVARLQHRVPYLSPEQIANEATSAATDVFALGVIAYELVTGQRAFPGTTPQQVAQAIMQGPPLEPPLPRPIVRVLQRCLARSPFERFPDARALADALDAALRVAPVPGSRKDIGAETKVIVDRLAALHDGEMSGMVALHVGTGPVARMDLTPASTPESTRPDMPRPGVTFPGLAPPPIPVPSGIASGSPALLPAHSGAPSTLLGIAHAKVAGAIPNIALPRPVVPRKVPSVETAVVPDIPLPPDLAPSGRAESVLEMEIIESLPADDFAEPVTHAEATIEDSAATMPGPAPAPARAARAALEGLREPGELPADLLGDAEFAGRREMTDRSAALDAALSVPLEVELKASVVTEGDGVGPSFPALLPRAETEGVVIRPAPASPPLRAPEASPLPISAPSPGRSRAPLILLAALLGGAAVAVGGWQLYVHVIAPDDEPTLVATGARDAAVVPMTIDAGAATAAADAAVTTTLDAAAAASDAATAVAAFDAAIPTAPVDAASVVAEVDAGPATAGDTLIVTSTPAGARVYLDGADTGTTPIKLPGSPDRHTIALLLPGYELHTAEVTGSGSFDIPLKETTPAGGPAGIKVTRCKDKDRYYVFVDGKPTGMMCPTERIETDLGPHTVEVYDAVTETRKSYEIVVKDTRLSHRVKLE